MKVFTPRVERVRMSFNCSADLAKRLKTVEDRAKEAGLNFDLDEHVEAALAKLVATAEKELKTSVQA